jgi:hypothetical protein
MDTQKPDDIPDAVWEKAETHRQLWAAGPGTIKEAVARAILATHDEIIEWHMAEREKVEQLAVRYDKEGNRQMAMKCLARSTNHRLDAEAIRKSALTQA